VGGGWIRRHVSILNKSEDIFIFMITATVWNSVAGIGLFGLRGTITNMTSKSQNPKDIFSSKETRL